MKFIILNYVNWLKNQKLSLPLMSHETFSSPSSFSANKDFEERSWNMLNDSHYLKSLAEKKLKSFFFVGRFIWKRNCFFECEAFGFLMKAQFTNKSFIEKYSFELLLFHKSWMRSTKNFWKIGRINCSIIKFSLESGTKREKLMHELFKMLSRSFQPLIPIVGYFIQKCENSLHRILKYETNIFQLINKLETFPLNKNRHRLLRWFLRRSNEARSWSKVFCCVNNATYVTM